MSSKDLDDIGMRNEEQEREDLDDDSMRDENVNEDEDDEIETLTKMVTGCEAFVTSAVIGLTNEIEEKSKLNAERFEQCLKERDAKISELTKRLDQFEDVLRMYDGLVFELLRTSHDFWHAPVYWLPAAKRLPNQ